MTDSVKYLLDESRIPKAWYNLQADLPKPLPAVLHPGTGQPIGPEDLLPLFPMELIRQEVTTEREVEIPGPVRDVYRQWRVTPLYRARRQRPPSGRRGPQEKGEQGQVQLASPREPPQAPTARLQRRLGALQQQAKKVPLPRLLHEPGA